MSVCNAWRMDDFIYFFLVKSRNSGENQSKKENAALCQE